jgi:hypothetical protein
MARFEAGEISSSAMKGLQGKWQKPGVLRKTRVNRPNEEEFHGKQGLRDQGGPRLKGPSGAKAKHINNPRTQRMGPKPSKGGAVGLGGQPEVDHVDQSEMQMPQMPAGAGMLSGPGVSGQARSMPPGGGKPSPGGAAAGKPPSRGAPPMQRPGKQSGYYSAASRRP